MHSTKKSSKTDHPSKQIAYSIDPSLEKCVTGNHSFHSSRFSFDSKSPDFHIQSVTTCGWANIFFSQIECLNPLCKPAIPASAIFRIQIFTLLRAVINKMQLPHSSLPVLMCGVQSPYRKGFITTIYHRSGCCSDSD